MKSFLIDINHCFGCYCCQLACKDEHVGNDWTPYAKPQPNTGQYWGKLKEYERGQVPKVKLSYIFVPCQHCDDAPCISACPVDGVIYKRDDGLVIIDPVKCNGCMNCVDACPYGAIYFNNDLGIAQKCTGCAHLLDKYGWNNLPRCADVCATEAIKFGEESELDMSDSGIFHPEFNVNPRVHYIGLPKKFVAGCIFDSSTDEVAIGANCTLTGESGTFTAKTDEFGDFWFNDLAIDTFTLKIEANGKTKTIDSISTDIDRNVGDIDIA
ncbi:MAG: 4Fe-4S dicluster domain-containing protein [Eubacteriales bacterium]